MKTFQVVRTFTRVQEQTIEAKDIDEAEEIADKLNDWEEISVVDVDGWEYEIKEV